MIEKKEKPPAMELLAPAGSFSAFEAALEEGADAIYVGAPHLNARALARDFSYAEIDALVRGARRKGVRVYIAMNSLVKENEIGLAAEGLAMFEEIQPDAIIIQDLGLFRLARSHFPSLSLHASTLMSVHNSLAVLELAKIGFKRVVLPRELTLEEITDISSQTGVELEVFVHGAMCFSYSGLCMFSSMYGGKSSLRGQCVQPCRRRYSWQTKKGHVKQGRQAEKDGGYLFSMNDLCGIDLLSRLRAAGVSCLKIEGRLKSAEYVRKTVRAYRLLLDDPDEKRPDAARQKEAEGYLDEAMGRRRSSGFFLSPKPGEAVTPGLSGNIGLPVGKVVKIEDVPGKKGGGLVILSMVLSQEIQIGERLRLHDERSGERMAFTLRTLKKGSRSVKKASGGERVQVVLPGRELKMRRGEFRGRLFKVDVGAGKEEEMKARAAFLKKGGKPPEPDRRKIDDILKIYAGEEQKRMTGNLQGKKTGRLPVWVRISSLRDRQYRLPLTAEKFLVPVTDENMELLRSAPAKLRQQDRDIIWCLPPIIREEKLGWYRNAVSSLLGQGFTAFQLGHVTQSALFDMDAAGKEKVQLYGGYTCNVLNSLALAHLHETGFAGMQFSLETDEANLELAMHHFHFASSRGNGAAGKTAVGFYAFGHPALFTARLDDPRYQYGKRFVSPRGEVFVLDRQEGITSARPVLPFSLLGLQKDLVRCGISYLVVDLTGANIQRTISELAVQLKKGGPDQQVLTGNFKSGLL